MIHTRTLTYVFRFLLLVCLLGGLCSLPTAIAQVDCEYPFSYTGDLQTWTVPPGVDSIRIEAAGGQGGNETICSVCELGGQGAKVAGDFAVTPGETLQIIVAGKGGDHAFKAGGGGATFIARGNSGFSDFVAANLLLIAGGGGGAFFVDSGEPSTIFQATATGPGGNNGGNNAGGGGASAEQDGQDAGSATGGQAAINGAAGGSGIYASGGFGGGGASDFSSGGGGGATGGNAGGEDDPRGRAGTSYNGGANPVNTAAANSGNGYVIITPLNVPDTISPVAICQDVTVQLDANGNASVEFEAVDNGTYDNCGIASLDLSMTSFDCSNVGSNNVTLTATDDSDNFSICTATVTVEDDIAPVALCQDITVQLEVGGDVTIMPADVDSGSFDNCTSFLLSLDNNAFNCNDIGSNMVQLTISDLSGNSNSCNANVIIEDKEGPTITECEGNFVVFNGEDELEVAPAIDFSATDACGLGETTYSPAVITCDQLGTEVEVTITVMDANGNPSTCITTVKVDGLPCGFMDFGDDGIDCEDRNSVSYDIPSETFTLASEGCYTTNFTQDNAAYVKAEMCGDGEIIAHITSIDPLGQGWAGITMRETEAPGAKKVELLVNLGNLIRRAVRTTTNGYAFPAQLFRPSATWLKLVRTGNQFVGYASVNGITWQNVLIANIPMDACIQAGLMVTNYNGNNTVTGTFNNVTFNGTGSMNLQIPNTDHNLPEATTLQDFMFFPNPVTSELQVDLSAFSGQEAVLRIYNQVGQLILQNHIESAADQPEKLELNPLASGTYFIEVISGEYRQVKKLLKIDQ